MRSEIIDNYLSTLDQASKRTTVPSNRSLLNKFVSFLEEKYHLGIQILGVDISSDKVLGASIKNDENGVTIFVSSELNQNWKRFVVAKELAALYLELEHDKKSRNIDRNISKFLSRSRFSSADLPEQDSVFLALALLIYEKILARNANDSSIGLEDEVLFKYKELIPRIAADVNEHVIRNVSQT